MLKLSYESETVKKILRIFWSQNTRIAGRELGILTRKEYVL